MNETTNERRLPMASLSVLTKWLKSFSSLAKPPLSELAVETLLTAYNAAFSGVQDKAFEYACEQYLRNGKYFPPRPAELQEIIPKTTEQDETKLEYRIRKDTQCHRCKKITLCIQEPPLGGELLCRECYSGMSRELFQKNMQAISRVSARAGYFAKYNSKTKTVSIVHVKPEGYDPLEDIIGGE